jgi:hypothetical protein
MTKINIFAMAAAKSFFNNTEDPVKHQEIEDFVNSITKLIENEINTGEDMTYSQKAIYIADARNHLFRIIDCAATDESENIFAIKELCFIDDEMNMMPDVQHIRLIARKFWY